MLEKFTLFCRANVEVSHLNDLVALLVVFGEGEEEGDPELQALRSELEQKAVRANKLVCASRYTKSM